MCIVLSGCLSHQINNPEFPITWNTGFTMVDLLESSDDFVLTSKADLVQLKNASWYAEFDMINTRSGESTFSTCQHMFDQSLQNTYTKRHSEYNAYLEFKTMCAATKVLINSKASKVSYIPPTVFTKNTPTIFPKNIAIQTSTLESKRLLNNSEINTWNDVTPITGYKLLSNDKAVYFNDSATQELEVIGTGDVNGDSIEDFLLVTRDSLDDGNYFNMRLFILSVDQYGNWSIIKESV